MRFFFWALLWTFLVLVFPMGAFFLLCVVAFAAMCDA